MGSILVSDLVMVLVEDFFLPFFLVVFFLVVVVPEASFMVEVDSVVVVWVPVTGLVDFFVLVSVPAFVSVV